jgi:preprotein translocase subunit YajC
MFATPAFAQAAGASSTSALAGIFIPLVLMIAIMYFLLIRPQQRKVKEHKAMVEALRRGDQIITQGGILGKVVRVMEDGIVEVEIAEGVKIRVVRATISQVVNKTEPAAA